MISYKELVETTTPKLYTDLTKVGFSDAEAVSVIIDWWGLHLGRRRRTFDFSQPFAGQDADCAPTHQLEFAHQDWVDGQSVVQAEKTVGEDGFNHRFHNIRSDLEGVQSDVAKGFACIAEMRAELSVALAEIREEMNRVNDDIYACCRSDGGPTRPEPFPLPQPVPFPRPVPLPLPLPGPVLPGGGGVLPGGGGVLPGQLGGGVRGPVLGPDIGPVISGALGPSSLVGVTTFGGQDVVVLSSLSGPVVLPAVSLAGPSVALTERAELAANFATVVAENPDIKAEFGNDPVRTTDLVEKFGDVEIQPGVSLKDATAVLPADAQFTDINAVVDAVADTHGAVVRETERARLGLAPAPADATVVADVPLDQVVGLDDAQKVALTDAGIATAGALARTDITTLSTTLSGAGLAASTVDITGLRARLRVTGLR
jgi:hypothetical protein